MVRCCVGAPSEAASHERHRSFKKDLEPCVRFLVIRNDITIALLA